MSSSVQEAIQVLHVDDEPDFQDLTVEFVEREDEQFSVVVASGATEALEIIDNDKPDCVVSDFDMPRVDGLEFLQMIRIKYPQLPVVFFTSQDRETIIGSAIAVGPTGYVKKEATAEQYEFLAEQIRSIL
ncbi:response regulator [Haloarcula marismortui]|uniref:HTR-like protein n=1 Tax=Haloarcula marismortui ATCC 33799 TaxID=662475 RepID=M0JZK9_9EURY|nr:response regulator [Haloarcula californiae]EMA13374.1 HTR-like protein [Haloarcula californiae ATCC 33799]